MKGIITTTRYRYTKDGRSGRTPTYTEWKVYVDGECMGSSICGQRFKSVIHYQKHVIKRFNLTEVIREKATTHNLGYSAQSM